MRKIFLLLAIILLSGCTINYNLTIDADSIDEDVKIMIPIDEVDESDFDDQIGYDRPVYAGSSAIYDVTSNADDNYYYANYKYKHKIEDFSKSSFLDNCYNTNNIKVTDDQISISTNSFFNCINMADGFHADEVDINIITKLKVQEHNADEIDGNIYKWHISEKNYTNKPIKMVLKKDKTTQEIAQNIVDKIPNKEIIYVCLFIFLMTVIIYVFVKHRQKIKNEI